LGSFPSGFSSFPECGVLLLPKRKAAAPKWGGGLNKSMSYHKNQTKIKRYKKSVFSTLLFTGSGWLRQPSPRLHCAEIGALLGTAQ